jgi:small basic protein (TIGR04137 family)
MSIDKSLKRKGGMAKQRCVLTRAERIAKMMENGQFGADRSPYGLPKTRVQKVVLKKKAKKEATEGEGAAAGATPAAGAATPAAGATAAAAAKPAAKK